MREKELYERVYAVVRLIPSGRVATYGQVAAVVGPPCDAREVGGAMAALRYQRVDLPVPWQRVSMPRARSAPKGWSSSACWRRKALFLTRRAALTWAASAGKDRMSSGPRPMGSTLCLNRCASSQMRSSYPCSESVQGVDQKPGFWRFIS
jgi:alkylated DNA nucleotide flippase Atl1